MIHAVFSFTFPRLYWNGLHEFRYKIIAAAVTTVSCLLVVIWYLAQPDILETGTGLQKTGFVLLNLIMVAATGVAGFIGGKLVFKD